ncbi:pyruvate, phosphate dikinase [Longibacter salinarum]|uniref:Pyruvate, phosphate dikinase n=1 Tax=Longibacter salinarum TaxID=1850348 RepID=A0A2A8CYQ6_9BACT|nr:pyruvate, phosphate dikinase [Longibacter salinarum]PEN13707.1 pyruvate, phosphate dikinase [Longibacter salinarum]
MATTTAQDVSVPREASTTWVYRFGNGRSDGSKDQKALLGGKGANLSEMSGIGLPVPPGYTITTEACEYVVEHDGTWPDELDDQVRAGIRHVEEAMGRTFGDPENPLLVSVRSGAALSMPGMMDSVLNLGLNDQVVEGIARQTGNERFAYDAYRRLIDMFGDVVVGIDREKFEHAITSMKEERGVENDIDLNANDLRELVDRYKAIYRKETGRMFPDDPWQQLRFAIDAVFGSWTNERAVKYREINSITGLKGTAVNVQAMVYGNMGEDSGTGVCFTRNPATGENKLYGEFLLNAQGEDVVAGIRTPKDIKELDRLMPEIYAELQEHTTRLERHYGNMQDIEFTVQQGELFILQTRDGKRTGPAAIRIAVEMVDEGLTSESDAVRDLVEPGHVEQLLHPRFKNENGYAEKVLGTGLPASPGAAVGRVVFTADDAEEWNQRGESVILVRVETSPEDVGGMDAAEGILTSRGGMTSHAAVVARGWGTPCVAGCDDIVVNAQRKTFTNGEVTVQEGDWISINGSTGEVILGKQPLVDPELSGEFSRFMTWADDLRTLGVRANADTPEDARQALEFGAEGIGLARTEHMFFGDDRIAKMQRMILADSEEERRDALEALLPFQREDFAGLFQAMKGRPVTIRLLDPPLHEFLPHDAEEQEVLAERLEMPVRRVREKIEQHAEMNPMLGHRGCRLGVTHAEITEMQARAILEAAIDVSTDDAPVRPEIMVPLVSTKAEFDHQRSVIDEVAAAVFEERGKEVQYRVGTMIEIPRAALRAGEIAEAADFFSFGTNDLTQMTFGFSRDDAGRFLPYYVQENLLPADPFQTLDQEGVGEMVSIGTNRGRKVKPKLQVGICGEHGGDPASVKFCHDTDLDYVSCSPFRVPIARLAAAQAVTEDDR